MKNRYSGLVDAQGQPMLSSEYEGATQGQRSRTWSAPSSGPNRAIASAGKTLRNRTRAAYRNSLLMRSAINKNTTSEVGRGFTLISLAQNETYRDGLNTLWKQVSEQLDPWGDLNFGSIMQLGVKSRRMSGEVFIRKVRRSLSAGLALPIQVEVLEADLCPITLNKKISKVRRIVQGVEYQGKVKVAFWFYKAHPDDGIDSVSLNQLERVPARDVIHHYMPTRPGQVRGEPETHAALLKNQTYHEYDDTELVRKKERAKHTGFLYRESEGTDDWEFDPATGAPLHGDDSQAAPHQHTTIAGTILRGVPGEKLEQFKGDDAGQGYKDYQRQQTLMLSTGLDIPHALNTGDWSGLNDRLVRAIMLEYRRGISFEQTNLSGWQMAKGIWRWVVETAIATGRLSAPGYHNNPDDWLNVDIRPDAWKHLHPVQDMDARTKAVNTNTSNIESEAAEYGRDLDDNMRRNARALKKWEDHCKNAGLTKTPPMMGMFSNEDAGEIDE